MRLYTLLTVLAAGLTLTQDTQAQQTFTMYDQTYQSDDQVAVKVAVSDADVTIASGDDDEFHIEIRVSAPDQDLARSYYDAQNYSVALNGATMEVLDGPNTRSRTNWRRPLQTHIILTTPELVDLRVRTSDGDLTIGNVEGDVFMRTSDGDIEAESLSGVMFEARTSDGDIAIESAVFKNVVMQTSDGDISVEHVDAEEVTAVTSDGDIHFGHLDGIIDVRTSDGDIHIGSLVSSSGRIRSSDGDVVLESVEGELRASTVDGDVVVDLVRFDAVHLSTSDGNIVVSIPANHGAELNLRASRVQLDCCASFEGSKDKRHIEGRVNGGGPPLQVSASDGTVVLRER